MKGRSAPRREPYPSELAYSEYLVRQDAVDKIRKGEEEEQTTANQQAAPASKPWIVARYLKQYLGNVSQLNGVSMYPPTLTDAKNTCIVRNRVRIDLEYRGDVPPEGVTVFFRDAVKISGCSPEELKMPVTVAMLCCTSYDNKSFHTLSGALSIMETYKPYIGVDPDRVDVQESIGALRHATMAFKANTSEQNKQFSLHMQHVDDPQIGRINFHYGNSAFMIMTRFLEPATNLRHGLVNIPASVCEEAGYELYDEQVALEMHIAEKKKRDEFLQSKMPDDVKMSSSSGNDDGSVAMDVEPDEISPEERAASRFLNVPDECKIRSWYAVPFDHVLSWAFHTSDIQRQSMGLRCKILNVQEDYTNPITGKPDKRNKPFCWIVPDCTVNGLIAQYTRCWHDKVDVRPCLGDVGITIAPPLKAQGTLKNVTLKLRINTYVIFWKDGNTIPVIPKLHSDFTPFMQFVPDPFSKLDLGKLKI